jgi:hypothetical protein
VAHLRHALAGRSDWGRLDFACTDLCFVWTLVVVVVVAIDRQVQWVQYEGDAGADVGIESRRQAPCYGASGK